jgi:hypothetical protein
MLSVTVQGVVMLSVNVLECHCAECHCAECHRADCHCGECRGDVPMAVFKASSMSRVFYPCAALAQAIKYINFVYHFRAFSEVADR